jgi:triphosphoribosyl-dephospho-CoA synthase
MPDTGLCAQLSCLWEATARKVGNVHRYQDFTDLTFLDLTASAAAVAPVLARAPDQRVGQTVLECIQATRQVAQSNSNLGIVLLLAPLAVIPNNQSESDLSFRAEKTPTERETRNRVSDLRAQLTQVLSALDHEDARLVYQAIRLARPGGLGQAPEQDVSQEPTLTLREAMQLAQDRDRIARQYVTDFADVFEHGVPALERGLEELNTLEGAIIQAQLRLLETFPDSLIARKRGEEEAEDMCWRARHVLNEGWPHERAGWLAYADLDGFLREEGHQRNPGTTADLLTASLFVLLRTDRITLPPRCPFPQNME